MLVTLPTGHEISDDRDRLDIALVHGFLSVETYWAKGRTEATVRRCIAHSFCLGAYDPAGGQVGFLRLVTDYTLNGHLTDVFVLPAARGLGLAVALVTATLDHPELATVRRWTLSTSDAHGLYARFGFAPLAEPQREMMRRFPAPG